MTKEEKLKLKNTMVARIDESITKLIDMAPEEWGNKEIKQAFEDCVRQSINILPIKGKAKKDYNNWYIINPHHWS